jgi:hypothetical protein
MSDDEKVKYVLELDVPNIPRGEGIEIPGLGVFGNGGEYEITNQQAENYRDANPTAEPVVGKQNEILSVDVSRGKTLLQQSRSMMEGITVSTYQEDDDQEEDVEPDTGMQMVDPPVDHDEDEGSDS